MFEKLRLIVFQQDNKQTTDRVAFSIRIHYRKCLENGPIDKFNVCVVSDLLIYPIC